MGNLTRYQSSSARLLTRILERPELTAAVRELPVPVLATLIDRVGLEDAGEIVALASPAQLERVLDHDVWRAPNPGGDEQFSPERFALWLSVMLEAGEDVVAQRLSELPRETLALAIHRLVLVLDAGMLAARNDYLDDEAPAEAFEEFRLCARDSEAWDVVWTCLIALDRDHHELLRALLEQCSELDRDVIYYERDLHEVSRDTDLLESDVAEAREDRRSAAGFVNSADARAFLELARAGDEMGEVGERDAITHAYFRAVEPAQASSSQTGASSEHTAQARSAQSEPSNTRLRVRQPDLAALVELVRGDELALGESPSATDDAQRSTTLFDAAMSELGATRPHVFAERMHELGYLANVLIAGGTHQGRAFRPVEALECAIAACNAGLEDALTESASIAAASEQVARTAADRMFRAGYHLLHALVVGPAQARLEALCAAGIHADQEQLVRRALQTGTVFGLQADLEAEDLGLDPAALIALLALIETGPWFAGSLARAGRPFVADRDDLRTAQTFIASLLATDDGA